MLPAGFEDLAIESIGQFLDFRIAGKHPDGQAGRRIGEAELAIALVVRGDADPLLVALMGPFGAAALDGGRP